MPGATASAACSCGPAGRDHWRDRLRLANLLSLYAIAALSDDLGAKEDAIYDRWLSGQGYYAAGLDARKRKVAVAQVRAVLSRRGTC